MAIGANLTKRDQMLISAAVLAVCIGAAYGYFLYLPKGMTWQRSSSTSMCSRREMPKSRRK